MRGTAGPIGPVPEAEPIADLGGGEVGFVPHPEGPELSPGLPGWPGHRPLPIPKPCKIDLQAGCYRITFKPNLFTTFRGTLRVEDSRGSKVVSGDLYRFFQFPFPFEAADPGRGDLGWPDPVVRPGGHSFGAGHGGPAVPSADIVVFGADELDLRVEAAATPVESANRSGSPGR